MGGMRRRSSTRPLRISLCLFVFVFVFVVFPSRRRKQPSRTTTAGRKTTELLSSGRRVMVVCYSFVLPFSLVPRRQPRTAAENRETRRAPGYVSYVCICCFHVCFTGTTRTTSRPDAAQGYVPPGMGPEWPPKHVFSGNRTPKLGKKR